MVCVEGSGERRPGGIAPSSGRSSCTISRGWKSGADQGVVGEGSESVGDDTSSAEVVLIERRYAFSGQVVGDSGAEDMISVSKVHCELDLLLSTGVYEERSICQISSCEGTSYQRYVHASSPIESRRRSLRRRERTAPSVASRTTIIAAAAEPPMIAPVV